MADSLIHHQDSKQNMQSVVRSVGMLGVYLGGFALIFGGVFYAISSTFSFIPYKFVAIVDLLLVGAAFYLLSHAAPVVRRVKAFFARPSFSTQGGQVGSGHMVKQKFIDPLTNLPNRDALRQCVEAAAERGTSCALLQLDIVRLARINEALGADVGDQTIVHVAHRLTRIVRNRMASEHSVEFDEESQCENHIESITLGRLSGDQFGVVIQGKINDALVHDFSRALVASFMEPFQIEGHVFSISCRIGIALAKQQSYDFTTLLNTTGLSLAEAKRIGRAIIKTELTDVRGKAYKDLIVEQELRQALKRDELRVFYQPQVSFTDGQIVGAEALIRWMHPERGLLSPAYFIDLAEEAGLLSHIGNYVLESICAQSVEWAKSGFHPRLSMNISASHCRSEHFSRDLLAIIANHHAQPEKFEIEITETVAMQDVEHAVKELTPLKEAGLRLAVDDFGTGYSNLAALSRLPFDVLKIDRGFVMGCENDRTSRTMVSTILRMAQNLGYQTVAEGVETLAQEEFLKEQNCNIGQGFLYGRPMPAEAFSRHYVNFTRELASKQLQGMLRSDRKETADLIRSTAG